MILSKNLKISYIFGIHAYKFIFVFYKLICNKFSSLNFQYFFVSSIDQALINFGLASNVNYCISINREMMQLCWEHPLSSYRTSSARGFFEHWSPWKLQAHSKGEGELISAPFLISKFVILLSQLLNFCWSYYFT